MKLTDTFHVSAPVDAAWQLLNDIPAVVPCIPGAELTETLDDNSWRALVHVKLGPMALQFATDVLRTEADHANYKVALSVKARELRGRGGARATINSSLTPLDGGTRVNIETDLTLQGAVAQYGRGIVPDIASQLTRQFAENLATRLDDKSATTTPTQQVVAPVSGLRLTLRAMWRRLRRTWSSS
jgi:uncharacterized protein